jgi:hypothetical protein
VNRLVIAEIVQEMNGKLIIPAHCGDIALRSPMLEIAS